MNTNNKNNNRLPVNVKKTIYEDSNKVSVVYKYYNTEIVAIHVFSYNTTQVHIDTGEFFTQSTARRIKNLLNRHGISVEVSFAKNDRYIQYKGAKYSFNGSNLIIFSV